MKLVDVISLTPEALRSSADWLRVVAARYPDATLLDQHNLRYQWLSRLAGSDVWGDVQIVTSLEGWLFWRLVNPRVEVVTETGRKMTKAFYTQSQEAWAAGLVAGDHRKAEVNKVLKALEKTTGDTEYARKYAAFNADFNAPGVAGSLDDVGLIETDGTYETVTRDTFDRVRAEILQHASNGGMTAWDSETDQNGEEDSDAPNPYTARLVGHSMAIRPRHAWYFPVAHEQGGNLPVAASLDLVRALYPAARRGGARVLLHNAKYDYSVLCNPVQSVPADEVYGWLDVTEDTMLFANVLQLPAKLKVLAPALLGVKHIDFRRLTRNLPFSQVPLGPATIYGGQDSDWLLRLWPLLSDHAAAWDQHEDVDTWHVYHDVELPLIEYLMRIERNGMFIDHDKFVLHWLRENALRDYARKRLFEACRRQFIVLPEDFNPQAPEQVRWLMYDKLRLPVVERTKTGLASTGSKARMELKARGIHNAVVGWLDAWSEHQKRDTAFLKPIGTRFLQSDRRIRPTILQVGADTGRTSEHDPNGQQFYEELRACVTAEGGEAEDGEVAAADYSQVELRALAAVHHEPEMLAVYQKQRYVMNPFGGHLLDAKGKWVEDPEADIHGLTQRKVGLPNRTKAKNFNFGTAFGAGAPTLSKTAGIPLPQTEAFVRQFWAAYPSYARSLRTMQQRDFERGFSVTWAGRPRLLNRPDRPHDKQEQYRLIANTPVQGGALDIAKWAMRELLPLVRQAEPLGISPLNFVHDEFDFEKRPGVPTDAWEFFMHEVKRVMVECNPFPELVPLDVDIEVGKSWGVHQLREMKGSEKTFREVAEFEAEMGGNW